MKIRIRFAKEGIMKFIGHLDMMRYFQKAFRRSGIDIEYSQGFSPHQLISFASPLGVGLTSTGEYMDIFVHSSENSKVMIEKLNHEMAEGVRILSFKKIEDETRRSNAMSLIAAADYEVVLGGLPVAEADFSKVVDAMMKKEQILITKETKKSVSEVNIRPMIHKMYVTGNKCFMKVACGSSANLRPELVIKALCDANQWSFDALSLSICRREMYAEDKQNGGFISLDDLGQEIL